MVRADVLGVPRDQVGGRHGVIGGAFSLVRGRARPGVRHVRRSSSQAHGDAAGDRDRRSSASSPRPLVYVAVDGARPARAAQPVVLAARRAHVARLGRRQMRGIALSTCVTLLVPERPPRPGERHGRHGHRRVVRDHVGVQRPRHRHARDGLGLRRRARAHRRSRSSHLATITIDEPEPEPPADDERAARVDIRGARRGDPRGARALDADPARRVQQPARRRVHGADGRLRARRSCRSRRGACCGAFISLAFIAGGLVVAASGSDRSRCA